MAFLHRVDMDGGAVEGPSLDREPITGPVGVALVCGGGGGAEVVGFGAVVGCGRLVGATGAFEVDDAAEVAFEDGCESLMAPPLGRSPGEVAPCAIGSPLGRSAAPVLVETAALFASCPGGLLTVLLQAAQTRAAATAVAAALAGATVPRIGMDATVTK